MSRFLWFSVYVIDCTMHTARLPSALYCVRRLCFCNLCCTQCTIWVSI